MAEALVDELWLEIFSNLSSKDLVALSRVCHAFNLLTKEDILWYHCVQREKEIKYKSPSMSWQEHFKINFKPLLKKNVLCPHFNNFTKMNAHALLRKLDGILDRVNSKVVGPESVRCHTKVHCLKIRLKNHIGCGRRDNAHALKHALKADHPISIKLNTMDLWCYSCNSWIGVPDMDRHPIECERFEELRRFFMINTNTNEDSAMLERRKIERGLRMVRRGDFCCAPIPMAFEKMYERFIIGDAGPPVGDLDCSVLLDSNQRFIDRLHQGVDYVYSSLRAFEYFQRTYNAKPLILVDFHGPFQIQVIVDPPNLQDLIREQDEADRQAEELKKQVLEMEDSNDDDEAVVVFDEDQGEGLDDGMDDFSDTDEPF